MSGRSMAGPAAQRSLLIAGVNVLLAAGLGFWLFGPWGLLIGLAVYATLYALYRAFKALPKRAEPRQTEETNGIAALALSALSFVGVLAMAGLSLVVGTASMLASPLLRRLPEPPAIKPRLAKLAADWGRPETIAWMSLNAALLLVFLVLWLGVQVILVLGLIATPICLGLIALMAARGRDPY